MATAGELKAQGGSGANKFKLDVPDNTKLIVLEDSYGGIDRDYDDFYWQVDTVGIKPKEVIVGISAFIKQNYLDHPFWSSRLYEGDDRANADGTAVFNPTNNSYRTRQLVTLRPTDALFNDEAVIAAQNAGHTPSVGTSHEYDRATSLVDGRISAAAKADTILNDNVMKVASGTASTTGMTAGFHQFISDVLELNANTIASNPLFGSFPAIDISTYVYFDYRDPLNPRAEFKITHDGFPCYEVALDDTIVYKFDSGANIGTELAGNGEITKIIAINLPKPERLP